MKFIADETRADGIYSVHFEAEDWIAAEAHCVFEGITLLGELGAVIPASEGFGIEQANELLEAMNQSQNETKQ